MAGVQEGVCMCAWNTENALGMPLRELNERSSG